ncbi:MAG TPA: DUF6188 family protein [Thermoanaerobaculia bacterium]|jgi:hypothetical protein
MVFVDEDSFFRLTGSDLVAGAITVSQMVTINFEDQAATRLVINGRFLLETEGGIRDSLTVERPTSLGPLFVVLRDRVNEITVNKRSADLWVHFAGGVRLLVAAEAAYESWELYDSRGLRLIALPGGDVAYWRACET